MDKVQKNSAQKWCDSNGWTNMFIQEGKFYAFPPSAVIPQPLPESVQSKNDTNPTVIVNLPNGSKRVLLLVLAGLIVVSLLIRQIVAQQLTSVWLVPSYMAKITLSNVCFYGRALTSTCLVFVFGNAGLLFSRQQILIIDMKIVLAIIVGVLIAEFCHWMELLFGIKYI